MTWHHQTTGSDGLGLNNLRTIYIRGGPETTAVAREMFAIGEAVTSHRQLGPERIMRGAYGC